MTEMWASIPGWETLYEASTEGRIKSLARVTTSKTGWQRQIPERVLAPFNDGKYLWVTLNRPSGSRKRSVHSLVLETFRGPRPTGMESLHSNGDGTDNRLLNLRWGTKSENRLDSVRHGTHAQAKKTHCPRGHLYDEANIYWRDTRKRYGRACRTCVLESQRNARRAKLERVR